MEVLPQQAYGAEQDEQHQQPGNGKSPAPALAQDAAAVFLIIGHKKHPAFFVFFTLIIQHPAGPCKWAVLLYGGRCFVV